MSSVLLAAWCSAALADPSGFVLSTGFSDDAVLQRAPAMAAIYGLTPSASANVTVTVVSTDGASSYTVDAVVGRHSAGGTTDPLCFRRCLDAGHCSRGQSSSCAMPSCAMGCLIAGVSPSLEACKKTCGGDRLPSAALHSVPPATFPDTGATPSTVGAGGDCVLEVQTQAGHWHPPGVDTANLTLQTCGPTGPTLLNGTVKCSSCGEDECTPGCEFGFPQPAKQRPVAWKALLRPHAAGGSYTIILRSSDAADTPIVLRRISFGDVIVCGGQSNMDLSLEYTFSKPELDKAVAAGAYDDVRMLMYGNMGIKYIESSPVWATTQGNLLQPLEGGGTWGNMSAASRQIGGLAQPEDTLYTQFSATCFYFGAALVDARKGTDDEGVPLGLLQSAIGGSQIEAWTPDGALGNCANESLNVDGQAPPARLFNGMIAPFVNMTVGGFVFYQGENNCGGTMGNSAKKLGYGCQLPSMIAEWRRLWSTEAGTTAPDAPFGVVTLASGGSEGHPENMAGMRWSQTANYGSLPNTAMPNTFLAQAYDLGDPMDNLREPCINSTSGAPNRSAFADGSCAWPPASRWNAAVRPLRDAVFANTAPSFMGGIHPRFKREVGRRLALAFLGAPAPTLAGCTLSTTQLKLRMQVAVDDAATLQWQAADWNQSAWGTQDSDSSALMLCAGKPGTPPDACAAGASMWMPVPLANSGLIGEPHTNGTQLQQFVVDLAALNGSRPLALRYAWPLSSNGDTCCPAARAMQGRQPCVPASCPIITSKNALPANPFYAIFNSEGRCQCEAPTVCNR